LLELGGDYPKIVIGKNFYWPPLEITGCKKLKYTLINIIEVIEKRKAICKEILLVNRDEKNPENPLILKILILTN
jgi:hypothetical protein